MHVQKPQAAKLIPTERRLIARSQVFVDRLAVDLEHYSTYRGISETQALAVGRELNSRLGGQFIQLSSKRCILKAPISVEKRKSAERYMEEVLGGITGTPFYENVKNAYLSGDQDALKRLIPRLFNVEVSPQERPVYHGISVPWSASPETYVDLVVSLLETGILPSLPGIHHSMDRNIQPIYSAGFKQDSYGCVFFPLEAAKKGYAIFIPVLREERLIYTTRHIMPEALFLKREAPPAPLFYADVDESKPSPKATMRRDEFRDCVQEELIRRKVPFRVTDA